MSFADQVLEVSELDINVQDSRKNIQNGPIYASTHIHETISAPASFFKSFNHKIFFTSPILVDLSHRKLEALETVPPSRIIPEGCETGVRLHLNDNALHTFSLSHPNSSQILILELSFNSISCLSFEMDQFPNLRTFNASNNKISGISDSFYGSKNHESLEILNLGGNKIQRISKNIEHFVKLIKLSLLENPIEKLPVTIKELVYLKSLALDWWHYCNPPTSGMEISTMFKFSAMLHRLAAKRQLDVFFTDIINEFSHRPLPKMSSLEQFRCVSLSIKQKQTAITMSLLQLLPQIIYFNKNSSCLSSTPINLFYKAIRWNNEAAFHRILENYQPVFQHDDNLLLYTAIEYSSPDIVLALLKKGADPNAVSKIPEMHRTSAISYAIQHSDKKRTREIISHLLNFGANPWIQNDKGKSSWHFTIILSNLDGLEQLASSVSKKELSASFNDQVLRASGNTMLHLAACSYSLEIIMRVLDLFENQDFFENMSKAIPLDLIPNKRISVRKIFLNSFRNCVKSIYEQRQEENQRKENQKTTKPLRKIRKSKMPLEEMNAMSFRRRRRASRKYLDPETNQKASHEAPEPQNKRRNLRISDPLQFGDLSDTEEHPENEGPLRTAGYFCNKLQNPFGKRSFSRQKTVTSCRNFGVSFSFKEINTLSSFITKLESGAISQSKAKIFRLFSCRFGRSTLYSFLGKAKPCHDGTDVDELLHQIDKGNISQLRTMELLSEVTLACLKRLGVLASMSFLFAGEDEQKALQEFYRTEYPQIMGHCIAVQGELTTDSFGFLLIKILETGLASHESSSPASMSYLKQLSLLNVLRVVLGNSWFLQDPIGKINKPISKSLKLTQDSQDQKKEGGFAIEGEAKRQKEPRPPWRRLCLFEFLSCTEGNKAQKAVEWQKYFPDFPQIPKMQRKKGLRINEESCFEDAGEIPSLSHESRMVQTPSLRINKTINYFS